MRSCWAFQGRRAALQVPPFLVWRRKRAQPVRVSSWTVLDLFDDFDVDVTLTVAVAGNSRVGKTALIRRFARGTFAEEYHRTIAADFVEKTVLFPASSSGGGQEVTFHMWDLPGGGDHSSTSQSCCRRVKAGVIAFASDDRASFEAVKGWVDALRQVCGPDVILVLAQTKHDLVDGAHTEVPSAEVTALAEQLGVHLCLTNSQEGLGVGEVFDRIGLEFLEREREAEERFRNGEARGGLQWEASGPGRGAAWTEQHLETSPGSVATASGNFGGGRPDVVETEG